MAETAHPPSTVRGRPVATSHAAIERVAFRLFAQHGFARTTLDAIAAELGVSRRTLFRYYQSKNDIPWGQFDQTLDAFREMLHRQPADLPLWVVIHRAVLEFNSFPGDSRPSHVERMRLILSTPELQAHSVLRYADWRQVIAEYVADRTGSSPEDLAPQVVGQVSLALTLSAYDAWLSSPQESITELIDAAMAALRDHLATALR